ncbi:MAG: hypothetical protein IKH57_19785, partial [Clostridia bacterium]|nr:hypothetical protein [Clostridia bacterium]
EPTNSQPFFPLSQQPPFMAYLLLMHFCPFSPIPLFKLPYLGATEQLPNFQVKNLPPFCAGGGQAFLPVRFD